MNGWWERSKTLLAKWLPFLPVSWHRKALAWLDRHGYRPVEVLCWEKAYRVEKGGQHFVFKRLSPEGLVIWQEVLSKVGGPFRRLVIPEAVTWGQDKEIGSWILRRWLDGKPMCPDWSELLRPGGMRLAPDGVEKVVDLLEDLAAIDAAPFLRTGVPRRDRSLLQEQIRREVAQAEKKGLA